MTLASKLTRWLNSLSTLVLPISCLLCGGWNAAFSNICSACFNDLPKPSSHCCQCANQLPTYEALRCGQCIKEPPPFDLTHALFLYEPPIISCIHELKFKHSLKYAKLFGELLAEQVITHWYKNKPLPDLILPVPLHTKRLKERGFNQALEIARAFYPTLPLLIDMGIKRIRPTHSQHHLSREKRSANVKDAFVATRYYTNLTIAILDDVMTTGCTVAAISKTLKEKGAKSVHVWCCARRNIALNAKTL